MQNKTNSSENTNRNDKPSLEDRKRAAKEILTDREPNLSLDSAFEFVDEDELRYFFFTISDIMTYFIDNESSSLDWRNNLHGAIRLQNLARREIVRRMEEQGFDVEFAGNLK